MQNQTHTVGFSGLLQDLWRSLGQEMLNSELMPKAVLPAFESFSSVLISAYGEPHRAYHSHQHLVECLENLQTVKGLIDKGQQLKIEMALWFHDAIYDVRAHDNEAKSAAWAEQFLENVQATSAFKEDVKTLIMATCHSGGAASEGSLESWIIDIDLSILGSDENRFDEYEQQIRQEYAFVPAAVFNEKRSEILQGFLNRPQIFMNAFFHLTKEMLARNNLNRALASWQINLS